MLSREIKEIMREENVRHFNYMEELKNAENEISAMIKQEIERHQKLTKFLHNEYKQVKASEVWEAECLKFRFDELCPIRFADFYSLEEILGYFERKDFKFMREMKLLEECGQIDNEVMYTPTWR